MKSSNQKIINDIQSQKTSSKEKNILQTFASLPKRTRLIIGLSGIAFALLGSYASDKLEEKYPSEEVELFNLEVDKKNDDEKK